ncbi:hypothetical protein CHS0354_015578 [Potamilus streckersoni]|uniref:Semialdehyde dehydrogenase NAD-binding domain-containing protein n=1 Tax=Potamilus streckersoni TaxID=2493646 RepID=A0AAE0SV99_9BIVA|nr:hypothetical protein CHS0354_015578 [Potamilus streckersoni]
MLWFKCDEILGGVSLAVLCLALILGGYFFSRDLTPCENASDFCSMAERSDDNIENFKQENNMAFIVGYTGETGSALVKQLARDKIFKKVFLIGRRKVELPPEVGPEFEQKQVDFDDLDSDADIFEGIDVGFCCLGTTRGKSGAGQMEEALKVIHFPRLSIYRPAVLMVNREETRPLEAMARFLLIPIAKMFPTAITTPMDVLVKAMVNNVVSPSGKTVELLDNKAIHYMSGISVKCKK